MLKKIGALRMLLVGAVIAAVGAMWSVGQAQQEGVQPAQPGQAAAGDGLAVGTYEPQEAFTAYHRTAQFQEQMQQLQIQAQQDPQAAQQVQQQAQQMQQELIQNFERDIEQAVPEVAQERGVSLVAAEVVYQDRQAPIEVQDLTQPIVERINEGAEAPAEEPAFPDLP